MWIPELGQEVQIPEQETREQETREQETREQETREQVTREPKIPEQEGMIRLQTLQSLKRKTILPSGETAITARKHRMQKDFYRRQETAQVF